VIAITPDTSVNASVPPWNGGSFSNDVGVQVRVLARLREHALHSSAEIRGSDALFEDLEAVLGEHTGLSVEDIGELTPRLRLALRRILDMTEGAKHGVAAGTIERARTLLSEQFSPDSFPALGHLRRLAATIEDLLDQLLEDMP
jgi:hypothetical protein